MRKFYKPLGILRMVLALFAFGFLSTASAQLSGSYTLDSNSATGGSNFKKWADFRSALVSNGVNGAVTLDVKTDEVLTSQLSFPAITGASSTNTIKINGGSKVVEYGIADAVILFDGIDYLTIDALTIRNSASNSDVKGIRVQNNSDNNTISNCTIEFSTLTATSTSSSGYIVFSTDATSALTTSGTSHGINNTISKNLMRTTGSNSPGPAFGIAIQGSSSSYSSTAQNNTITGNTIQNFYYMGIYMYYTNGVQVLNNDISRANATSNNSNSTIYGIYSYYSYAANRATKIDGNKIHDLPYNGGTVSNAPATVYNFYLYYNYGNSTYRFSVSNNTIKDVKANQYMYLGSNRYNYYFDLIGNMADNADVTVSTSSAYYFYGWANYYTYNSFRYNSNTIQNCNGGYYFYGINSYNPQSPNGVTEINDNLIQNNGDGYYYTYEIYSYYASSSSTTYPINIRRNTIRGNYSNYYYFYGIDVEYYSYTNITDNVVENNYSKDYYYVYCIAAQYYNYQINMLRNIVRGNYNNASYGYVFALTDQYNYNILMASNLVYDNKGYYGFYGIYAFNFNSGSGYTHYYIQNTIKNDGNMSSYSSHYAYMAYLYLYYDNNVRFVGNLIDCRYKYGYITYVYNGGNGLVGWTWDQNTYRVTNMNGQYWYNGSSTYYDFTNWRAAASPSGSEEYSVSDHNFTGSYASNKFVSQNNITTLSSNPTDVYGATRNPSKSDRGAVEGFLDIAQTANTFAPNTPMCAGGIITPSITFKNNFSEDVTGFKVGCTDNGTLKAVGTFTGSITVGGTGTMTFPSLQFSQAGAHKLKFFLLNADDLPSNDSMTFNFTVLKAPGGATLTQNTSLSSPAAMFVTTGKPDVTFPNEKLVYDLTAPGTLNYSNSDYSSKWIGSVTAKTASGTNANATVSSTTNAPFRVTLDAAKAWEDSTIELSIKIVDLVTGCDTIYKRKVLIAPKAVPNAKLPTVFCERTDLIFETTSTVSSGTIEYEWDFGDGSPKTTEASPSHNYATYGTYNLTLKTTTNPYGFTTQKVFTLNVTEVPTATIVNTNACEGTAVKLRNATVYGGSGVTSYTWDYGDGSPLVTTNSSADRTKNYAAPGGYKVTLTATADGCSNSTTKIVYQFSKPVANFSKTAGDCLNTEFKFNNNSTISLGQMGYLWDFNDNGNKATTEKPTYTFSSAGTKSVKLKVVSEFGCTDSLTLPITVKQTPTTDFTYPFACSRTATPFTNTTNLNGENLLKYEWNFGDGNTSTATSPLKNWFTIGPRIVKLKTTLVNGCATETSKIINVGVQPNVQFTVEDKCAGSEVPFGNQTTYTQGNIKYTWNFGDGNTSNTPSPVHTYSSGISQTYTVQLKAEIQGGCADSLSKTLTINPLPNTCDFDIVGNLKAAKTSPINMNPKGGSTSNTSYEWLISDGNTVTSSAAGAQYTFKAPGKYCITMIAKNDAGCECSATKCVSVTTSIDNAESMNSAVSIYPNPNNGVFNVNLEAEISGQMTVNIYNTVGELVKTVVVNGTSTSIDMSEYASGVYTVKVIADNQIATKKITITR